MASFKKTEIELLFKSYAKKHGIARIDFKEELYIYFNLFVKSDLPKTQFLILSQPRTGSTLLFSLLRSHPNICCEGEILYRKVFFPNMYVEERSKIKSKLSKKEVYGFKALIYQLLSNLGLFRSDMKNFILNRSKKGWKIIYVKRKNIFRQSISCLIAQKTRRWLKNKLDDTQKKIIINYGELLKQMRTCLCWSDIEKKILKNVPHLQISYEADLLNSKDHQRTSNKIFNYLGVKNWPVKTNLFRQGKDDLSAYILNYKEIKKKLMKTGFAKYVK